MLAKDPENRFATTTRMVEALRRGLETGEVMDDEIARRRESIPPPSVSRVMQKIGIDKPIDTPVEAPNMRATQMGAHNPAPATTPPPAASETVTDAPAANMRATQMGHDSSVAKPALPVAVAPAPSAPIPVPMPAALSPSSGVPAPIPTPNPSSPSPSASQSLPPIGAVPAPVRVPPAVRVTPSTTQPPLPAQSPLPAPPPPPAMLSGPPEMPAPLPPSATIPPPVDMRATHLGTGQQVRPRTPSASPPVAAEPRRRTGTPRVGVPVVAVAAQPTPEEEPNLPPVTGVIHAAPERSDRARKPTNDPAAISQVWYEDEELGPDKARKLISISTTDLYEDEVPRKKNRLVLLIGAVGVLVVGGAIALALGGGGDNTTTQAAAPAPAPIATPAAPVDAAPSTVIASDTPEAAVPAVTPDAATVAVVQPPVKKDDLVHADVPARHDPPTRVQPTPPTPAHPPTNDEDPAGRRVHIGGNPPTPPPHTDPKKPGVSGDGPVDPYGGGEASDGDSPAKKAEFYAGVGQQQLGSGDTAGAAASFKKATELDPNNATAAIGLGEIALRQGLFGDAIMHLNRAAKLAPKNSKVFTLLGYAYLNAGQNKQAAENFKKALQIDPDNAQARDGFNEASSRVPPPTEETP